MKTLLNTTAVLFMSFTLASAQSGLKVVGRVCPFIRRK